MASLQLAISRVSQTSKSRWCPCSFNSKPCDHIIKWSRQSRASHGSTLPDTAARLAPCQQLRALGLNHLHVSVQLKSSFHLIDSNKLALSVTSVSFLRNMDASFRLFNSSMCHKCCNNYIHERKKQNKKAHTHFCRRSPCLSLEDSASWSSSGGDLKRQRKTETGKKIPISSET